MMQNLMVYDKNTGSYFGSYVRRTHFMNDVNMWNDVEMHGFMTRIMGGIFEVASSSEFYGSSNFHGDANFQRTCT